MTDTLEHESASIEARERGMAFLVDGKHVSADRIMILSLPDTVGPISAMRTAKADAERTLQELEAAVARPLSKHRVEMTGQHLSTLMEAVGLEKKPHWDDTYLGMHSYITMLDIEEKVRWLVAELSAARADTQRLDWFDRQFCSAVRAGWRWSITADPGIGNVRLAMDSLGALKS